MAGVNAVRMARRAAETAAEFGRFVDPRIAERALAHKMTAQTKEINELDERVK